MESKESILNKNIQEEQGGQSMSFDNALNAMEEYNKLRFEDAIKEIGGKRQERFSRDNDFFNDGLNKAIEILKAKINGI